MRALLILVLCLTGCDLAHTSGSFEGVVGVGDYIGPFKVLKVRLCSKPYDDYEPMPWAVLILWQAERAEYECPSPGAPCVGRQWACDPPGSGLNWAPHRAATLPTLKVWISSVRGGRAEIKATW